jgi:hypothetical protein
MVADVTITFEMYYNVTAKLFYMLLYNILPFEKCKVNTQGVLVRSGAGTGLPDRDNGPGRFRVT